MCIFPRGDLERASLGWNTKSTRITLLCASLSLTLRAAIGSIENCELWIARKKKEFLFSLVCSLATFATFSWVFRCNSHDVSAVRLYEKLNCVSSTRVEWNWKQENNEEKVVKLRVESFDERVKSSLVLECVSVVRLHELFHSRMAMIFASCKCTIWYASEKLKVFNLMFWRDMMYVLPFPASKMTMMTFLMIWISSVQNTIKIFHWNSN